MMIEFKELIHKDTEVVIKYEDWKEAAERDDFMVIKGPETFVNPKNIVKAREMLLSDDFEIIYDSEFTDNELKAINSATECYLDSYGGTELHKEEYKNLENIYYKLNKHKFEDRFKI